MIVKHFKKNDFIVILEKGDHVLNSLITFSEEYTLKGAILLCGIGMLNDISIGYFNGKEYKKIKVENPMELLSMQGNLSLKENKPFWHIHCTFGNEKGMVFGGHLMSARVAVTAELFIRKCHALIREKRDNLFLLI